MSTDRERGDWIPWYCEDSPGWLELSLAARGAAEGISRKMGRKKGELHLGARGLRGLAVLLRCKWEELKPAMEELTSGEHPRFVVTADEQLLIDPGHASRQLKGAARRMFEKRQRDAKEEPSLTVTDRHNPSLPVTPFNLISSDLGSGSDLGSRESTPGANADEPPAYFVEAAQTVAMAIGGEVTEVGARWLEYRGARTRKGWAKGREDAVAWLSTVVRNERRNAREGPRSRGAEITKQPYDPDAPWLKLPEAR